ncbi:UNVERIFIED_CONTAM: hypothetical protein FKN15_045149 [Acipenser sinensis]
MNRTMGGSSPYRKPNMTFWSRSDPVTFPHVKTDHWSKMKNKVIYYFGLSIIIITAKYP